MTYKPLPVVEAALTELALDLENYRIPVRQSDENAALNYLYAEEEVYETARLILRDGYFDNEVPIVVADGGLYVVLEGNRRVSALKILHDPTLIPDHEHVIRALLKRYETEAEDLPDRIRVLVARSRDEAARHIARMHTTQAKRPWSLDQQATYYYSLLGPTMTVDDVRDAYPGVNIPRFMRMAATRRFLDGVRFSDRSLHKYVTGTELKMSAFEYAYKNADIAAAMGVTFGADGLLLPTNATPEKIGRALSARERTAVEYLMTLFRLGQLNTRSDEFRKNTEPHRQLLATLTGTTPPAPPRPSPPPATPGGASDSADPDSDNPAPSSGSGQPSPPSDGATPAPPAKPRGPNHPTTRDHLVLTGIDFTTHAPVTLQQRYHELRKLRLSETPVAAAMLLRAILESTIKYHFEATPTPTTGELKACMQTVKTVYGKLRPVQAVINKIDSADWRAQSVHADGENRLRKAPPRSGRDQQDRLRRRPDPREREVVQRCHAQRRRRSHPRDRATSVRTGQPTPSAPSASAAGCSSLMIAATSAEVTISS